jgi:hypothetical protein
MLCRARLVLFLLAFAAVGCGDDGPPPECRVAADCDDASECTTDTCDRENCVFTSVDRGSEECAECRPSDGCVYFDHNPCMTWGLRCDGSIPGPYYRCEIEERAGWCEAGACAQL